MTQIEKGHFLSGDTAQSYRCLWAVGKSHADLSGCCLILNISPMALWKIFKGCWPRIGLSTTCKATLVSFQRIHLLEGPRQWRGTTGFQRFQDRSRKLFQDAAAVEAFLPAVSEHGAEDTLRATDTGAEDWDSDVACTCRMWSDSSSLHPQDQECSTGDNKLGLPTLPNGKVTWPENHCLSHAPLAWDKFGSGLWRGKKLSS